MAKLPAYIIDSFRTVSDYENKGIAGAFKHGAGLDVRKRADTLSCQQGLRREGEGVIVDLILFMVPAIDGNTYLFGDTGKIYKRTAFNTISVVYTDPDGRITGAEQWWQADGYVYLFWQTATKVKSKKIPGQSNWSDVNATIGTQTYPKTNLTTKDWHTSAIAAGALLICNDDKLALVSYDESYTNNALQLVPGTSAKSLVDFNGQAVIAASSNDEQQKAKIYLWSPLAQNYIAAKTIPAKDINAIVVGEVILMQADDVGNIFFSDFINFLPVTSFPAGGSVNPDGVEVLDGVTYFGVFGATDVTKNGIWSYGRKKKNQPFAFNLDYPITCDEIGSIQALAGQLIVSYKVGTSYYLFSTNPSNKQVGVFESLDLYAPEKATPHEISTWKRIKVKCKPLPAGTSISAKYRLDKTGDWKIAKLEGNTAALSVTGAKKANFTIGSPADIAEVQITLTPTANLTPEITRVLVEVM